LPSLPKLYAILDTDTLAARGLDPRAVLDVWLDAGVRLIQLRAKSMPSGALLTLAQSLATTARSAGATFIVNDRADLAWLAGAAFSVADLALELRPTDAGQVGIFPEHVAMLPWLRERVEVAPERPSILNLFGYTGMVTLGLARAGAAVVHANLQASDWVQSWNRGTRLLFATRSRTLVGQTATQASHPVHRSSLMS